MSSHPHIYHASHPAIGHFIVRFIPIALGAVKRLSAHIDDRLTVEMLLTTPDEIRWLINYRVGLFHVVPGLLSFARGRK